MARQQRDFRLQTREARSNLELAREPYWHEVRRGLHLGYYKGVLGGSWLLRERRAGRYFKRDLGTADDAVEADGVSVLSWTQALKIALGDDRPTASVTDAYSLRECFEHYWSARRAKSPAESVATDQSKVKAHVLPKLGELDVNEITAAAFRSFRDGLVEPSEDPELMRKHQDSANRVWSIVRAALNLAYDQGRAVNPERWRRIKPFRNVDRPRTRFLTAAEAKRALNAMQPDMRMLARGALYTGLRLGELLALRAGNVDGKRVHVGHSKSGKPRTVPLDSEGASFFAEVSAGKAGDAPLFLKADGTAWYRIDVSRRMAAASTSAKIKPAAKFHDLRRTYASLLLNEGADVEIIRELLGHADLRMTMRAYAHLLQKTVAKSVEENLPSFGFKSSNVKKLNP